MCFFSSKFPAHEQELRLVLSVSLYRIGWLLPVLGVTEFYGVLTVVHILG